MRIGTRQIGPGHPPYVIAEIGVNHDGEVERALMLTDKAADAGADAVKLQFFETDRLMSSAAKLAAYQRTAGETDPVQMLRRLELSIDEMARVVERAHKRGIHAIVTVFSVELVEIAERLPWDAYKTASPDIVHKPLLERLMATGKPMIVSTGASTLEEVVRTVGGRDGDGWLAEARDRLCVLQCVSSYPAPEAALGGILAIHEATRLPTGYSDHTGGCGVSRDLPYWGGVMAEAHLTYDQDAEGPDHAASLEPGGFRLYCNEMKYEHVEYGEVDRPIPVAQIKRSEYEEFAMRNKGDSIVGPLEKRVLECEWDVRTVSRQSVVSTRALSVGETITPDMLTFKRPGTGILPFDVERVIDRKVARHVETDVPMVWDDVEGGKHA